MAVGQTRHSHRQYTGLDAVLSYLSLIQAARIAARRTTSYRQISYRRDGSSWHARSGHDRVYTDPHCPLAGRPCHGLTQI